METELVREEAGALEFLKNLSDKKLVLYDLKEKQRYDSADLCAEKAPVQTLRTLKCFYLDEGDKKSIVRKCAQKAPQEMIKELKQMDLSEEILFEAYKQVAELDGLEIINNFGDLKIKDKKNLYEIVKAAIENVTANESAEGTADTSLKKAKSFTAFLLAETDRTGDRSGF